MCALGFTFLTTPFKNGVTNSKKTIIPVAVVISKSAIRDPASCKDDIYRNRHLSRENTQINMFFIG